MRKARVISIVDDDDDVRASIANYFRAAGLDVRAFSSADAFLGSPEQTSTDCLVTDLNMPGLDGLGLQRALNRLGRTYPVIVMTGFPSASAREEATREGAAAFIEKPIDPDLLLETVEAILG